MKKKKEIFKPRYYKHIDKILDIKEVEDKIKDKDFIISHGFYPFLSYTIEFKKFSEEINETTNHHWKNKERPIKYASHIDRCIYQWYSYTHRCEPRHWRTEPPYHSWRQSWHSGYLGAYS